MTDSISPTPSPLLGRRGDCQVSRQELLPRADEREAGFAGGSARHHEYGPHDAELDADGLPTGLEIVVDPEVGLHVRPRR